jgi:hypothetical protein
MNLIVDLPRRLFGWVFRVLLLAAAAVFTLSLLLAAVVMLLFSVLGALLTGRKPAPVMVWQRYREASQASKARWTARATSGANALRTGHRPPPADVVDVTPRDVTPR